MSSFSDKSEVLDILEVVAGGLVNGTYISAHGHLDWVLKESKPADGWSVKNITDVQVLTIYLVRRLRNSDEA